MPEVIPDFLGTGWAFPPRLDAKGRIALVSRDQDIEGAIRIILLTSPGERQMRPEFGSHLQELIYAPCDTHTASLASSYVNSALGRWEPRIQVIEVNTTVDYGGEARLLINIRYRIRTDNSERNLVFPFYVIPGEN